MVVHGISATCKSSVVRGVLSSLEVPHAIVRGTECITGRHLLTKILWGALEALGQQSEWEKYGKGRCEHVSSLAVLLGQCLSSRSTSNGAEKFVLVLDGIDKQREAPQTLLAALARLGEIVSIICALASPGSVEHTTDWADPVSLRCFTPQLYSAAFVFASCRNPAYQFPTLYAQGSDYDYFKTGTTSGYQHLR